MIADSAEKQPRRRPAVALLLVLMAVAVATTLATSFLSAQSTSIGIARNLQNVGQARHVAEAGLQLAIAYVRANASWRTDRPNGTWVTDEAYAGGTFTIVGEDGVDTDGDGTVDGDGSLSDDNSDPVTITVTGKYNGPSQIARAVITPSSGSANAPHFAVTDKIEVKKNGVIDSYDSTVGAYGGANTTSSALISTNSTSNDKIKIKDNGIVKGNAQVGVEGDPNTVVRLQDSGSIIGTTSVLTAAVNIPTVSVPSTAPATQGDLTISSGTTTYSSDQRFNKLEINSSAIVEISGTVTIVCDKEFKLKDNAQLNILAGSTLLLYAKKLKVEKQALANANTADPSVFQVFLFQHDKVEIKSTAQLHATVLARNSELKVKDSAQFYGAFHGRKVKVEDSGQAHADVSSSLAGAAYGYSVAWEESP